ncbi:hypothetical protein DCS_07525 [Drechmeria coniospora]|uniref:ABC transporter n=1 Tax=Drechmeria coniospora TaxID=98403 RepID=A0A151GER8_DRECN|nr:hypothetical protein DCS_07525 [Drechmeria coniospora]KYK55562.1 hypothetical protein DCS_07525 [Drechmeria coniospora]
MVAFSTGCPSNADDQFGPRVDTSCRFFDFTLLFEDAFFVVLPAVLFLLLLPWRLVHLYRSPVKVTSFALATWKLASAAIDIPFPTHELMDTAVLPQVLMMLLLVLHLIHLVLVLQHPALHTSLAVPSAVLAAIAVFAAAILSFLEDQRSLRPSDMLALYFSASALLCLPRLRSLWLLPIATAPKAVWTVVFALTLAVIVLESLRKTRSLRPQFRDLAMEQAAGFWVRGFFTWLLPFFRVGYKKCLELDDIPKPGADLEEAAASAKLDAAWSNVTGRHRLLRATVLANLWPILSAVPPRIALACFTFCQPFLIERAVSNLDARQDGHRSEYAWALVGAFVLVYIGIAVSRALYKRQTTRLLTKMRAGLVSKIYRVTLTFSLADVKDSAAITLMGTNVERITSSLGQFHEVWISLPEMAVAIWLLARQIGVSCVVPLIICLASVAGASYIGRRFGPAQITWIKGVQKRVAVTAKMLSNMKAVKVLGLTDAMDDIITKLRQEELQASERFRKLLIFQIMTGNAPTLLSPFATFLTYALIAKVQNDDALLAGKAFTSISLMSLATDPLIQLCQVIPTCMQGIACFGNIEEYFLREQMEATPPSYADHARDDVEMKTHPPPSSGETLFSLVDAEIAWPQEDAKSILHSVNLNIVPGFTSITGPVASGKSTLLATMLGETTLRRGTMSARLAGVAYCSQTPWITDETIRRNITGDLGFDEKWYNFTIDLCCLQNDLKRLPSGDQTTCGSNGASLSGGQRQRVALARAVYSKLPIVILDDVTSGLDSATTGILLARLFSEAGHFRKAGISVIIATHSQRFLSYMDSIVVLGNGGIVDVGSHEQVMSKLGNLTAQAELAVDATSHTVAGTAGKEEPENTEASEYAADDAAASDKGGSQRKNGNWSVYSYYAKSAGALSITAPFSFFRKTDAGSITNRFSQDMDLIDMSLPAQTIAFTTASAACLAQLILICIVGKYLAAAIPVLVGILFVVQKYYLRTSRQVRLVDIEAKASIYKLFIETTQGLPTIRSFGWGPAFAKRNADVLNSSQRPIYMLFCIQLWLALVLDLVVGGLAVLIVVSAMAATSTVSAGSLGVALVLVLQFSSMLAQCVQAWTLMETSIGAVSRVQQFVLNTPSEHPGSGPPPPAWPVRGAIDFQSVQASYGPLAEPVLRGINLSIASGEKVALCGTTGSGKSSFIMAILLMMDFGQGRITIDDVDTSTLGGRNLRSHLNVVPQDPFFMPGSVRLNMDPRGQSSDDVIVAAIRKIGLWGRLESEGGLDADLDMSEWSQGEQQLLCLARAMLVPSSILILDEAMSRHDAPIVDEGTEAMMQSVIESEFRGRTILSVMHRFNHIAWYDQVVVMRNGEVVESGSPQSLLETDSAFSTLYHAQATR